MNDSQIITVTLYKLRDQNSVFIRGWMGIEPGDLQRLFQEVPDMAVERPEFETLEQAERWR